MIIVQLLGGLGNQMFQYALGRQLAILNDTELKLDTSILLNWTPGKHAVNRDFDLDIFNLKPQFATKIETLRYHSDGRNISEKIVQKIRKQFRGEQRTIESYYHFNPDLLQLRGDIYLAGTWQSYKYFLSIDEELRKDFFLKCPIVKSSIELYTAIQQSNSVCLNVRRTDYISVPSSVAIMASISIDYYKAALNEMGKMIGDFAVFIFSDDIEWCRNNFQFIKGQVHFVDDSHAGKKYSNKLQLMIACKHFIIPNSTFAWWAAWLNNDKNKKVIAPLQWFKNPSVQTNDLIPKEWIRL